MVSNTYRYRYLVLLSFVFCVALPAAAQEHGDGQMQHGGGHMHMHGMHGMIFKGSEKFPTSAYNETKKIRPIERLSLPDMAGDAKKGKMLAYAKNKGRCLSCHILGPDGNQPGNVGPNLSTYGNKSGRDSTYTFQQIWDARTHNPKTMMPAFGTNNILTKQEVVDIVAYVNTLKNHVEPPKRPQPQVRNFYVAGEDFTLADIYLVQGKKLFRQVGNNGRSCASCHAPGKKKGPDLKAAATTYPKYDPGRKRIISLEDRINLCRDKYMDSDPYRLGSRNSNLLTGYIKYLSRRIPVDVATDGAAAAAIKRGKASFFRKVGQLTLSCADCHVQAGGKWLRGQPLSSIKEGGVHSGTAATWPRHFIAGHDLGLISLQQRIRHCQVVSRTYPLKVGSPEYTEMELYLTTLANGKPMLAPTKSKLRGQD